MKQWGQFRYSLTEYRGTKNKAAPTELTVNIDFFFFPALPQVIYVANRYCGLISSSSLGSCGILLNTLNADIQRRKNKPLFSLYLGPGRIVLLLES